MEMINATNESLGKGMENLAQPFSNLLSTTQSLLSSSKLLPEKLEIIGSSVVSASEGTNKLIKAQTESIKYQRTSLNVLVTKASLFFGHK